MLQIENEYYSTIRPKRVARSGERPTAALRRAGVEYVELRTLDLSPFDPVGINRRCMQFLEIFLVYCLLEDSPPADRDEHLANSANHLDVARRGREPGLQLRRDGGSIRLADWATELCTGMLAVCELLDPDGEAGYAASIRAQQAVIDGLQLTPSARLLDELRSTGMPLFTYAMQISKDYRDYFRSLDERMNRQLELLAVESHDSLARQQAVEQADETDFETYLADYYR